MITALLLIGALVGLLGVIKAPEFDAAIFFGVLFAICAALLCDIQEARATRRRQEDATRRQQEKRQGWPRTIREG